MLSKTTLRRDVKEMGKISKKLKEADVGAIGIGAMIVFIAMVLVAGIAASVLVQTANRLEIQAMTTGEQTTAEVATGLAVIDIEGNKNSTTLNYLSITVQPRAGSNDIDLEQTFVEISDTSTKVVLKYSSADFKLKHQIDGDLFTDAFYTGITAQQFGVIILEDADSSASSTTPVINRGDKAQLLVNLQNCFSGLSERTDVWGMVQPEEGCAGVFSFRTPASFAGDTVFDLY
jgi:flagellin FlaB